MGHIIILFIAIGSFAGIVFIVWRKMPLLLELSAPREDEARNTAGARTKALVSSERVKAVASKNLDRTLCAARALAVKTENRTGEWLERLRKKSEERKEEFSESYWEQLRKKPGTKKKK